MNQGIDSLIGNRLDAYGSSPQALMERYKLTGETVDLLALQAAANTVNEAKNNMLANAETNMPNERQALEQEVFQGTRNQLLSQLGPGIQQQGQQMGQQQGQQMGPQQGQQMGPQQGLPTQPSNIRMAAQGGIVGYAQGGSYKGRKYGQKNPQKFPGGETLQQERERYQTLKRLEAKFRAEGNQEALQNVQRELENYKGSIAAQPPKPTPENIPQMAGGGIVGFAQGGKYNKGRKEKGIGAKNMDALLNALMVAESGGNPNAISSAGAEGAYQIMPSTAADPGFGVSPMEGSRFDPEASRGFARQYLQAMIDRYLGDIEVALIAYNAGAANADKFVAAGRDYSVLPQAAQTEPYVRKIMGQMQAQDNAESPNRNVNPRGRRDFSTNLNPPEARGLMARSQARAAENATDNAESPNRNVNPRGRRDFSTNLNPPEARGLMARSQQRAAADRGALPPVETSENVEGVESVESVEGALEYLQSIGRQQDQSAEGALDYLQNIGAQQEDRRARFDRAFPDVQPAVARAEQEKADGGIGYLRRLARKQEAKKQEGRRAARYLAMMQDSQNRINAADPAGRTEGQETPAADPDVLQYLAMLQENQNMVDAAGMPGEEEIEDVTTLIAGRGFNNGGGVRGFAGPDGSEVTLTEEEIDEAYRRRTGRDRPKSVFAPLQDFLGKLTTPPEYIINEAGFVVPNPSIRRTGEELAATMQEDADVLAEIEESVPGLSRAERVTLAGQELLDGRSTNKAEEPQFDPRSPQTGPFPEVPVVEEEDTSIKPDWNMLREWGAGGMGATNLADALGGSGRAVGAEIARQDKAALEERILTVKEAQMQIDKEIALAVSQQRMTSDVLDAIADLRR
jgi:hypothetical protein